MKKLVRSITIIFVLTLIVFTIAFIITEIPILKTLAITFGTISYHFIMRLLVGYGANRILKNQVDYNHKWFKPHKFEKHIFKLLKVNKWKYVPTYEPSLFDFEKHSKIEVIGAMCQAEIIHEIIMVLSFVPLALIPIFEGAAAFVVTSVLSCLFDSIFVIMQRYQRPKLIKILEKENKRKSNEK